MSTFTPEILTSPQPLPHLEGRPIILEIGPGRGDFLFELAQDHPDHWVIAIEYKRKRYEKLIRRIQDRQLNNVLLIKGDARYVLQEVMPPVHFEKVYILFSDPWPKKCHAKNRLIEHRFLTQLQKFMAPEGQLIIATDDLAYAKWMGEEFDKVPQLTLVDTGDHPATIFETFFAQKWKAMGKTLHAFDLRKGN
jgi:tRNA (guanine-N7-)-methyltransferase